jgi:hypothetical protein
VPRALTGTYQPGNVADGIATLAQQCIGPPENFVFGAVAN